MIDKRLLLLLTIGVLSLCACNRIEPEPVVQWTYRPIDPEQREITIRPPDLVSLGHRGVDAFMCPAESSFSCFRTSDLSFAVPKDLSDSSRSWEEGGVTYSVTAHRPEVLFGQLLDAYFIESTEGGNAREFMFSPDRGLLSMRIHDGTGATQLVSIEYCGFGAPASCRSP